MRQHQRSGRTGTTKSGFSSSWRKSKSSAQTSCQVQFGALFKGSKCWRWERRSAHSKPSSSLSLKKAPWEQTQHRHEQKDYISQNMQNLLKRAPDIRQLGKIKPSFDFFLYLIWSRMYNQAINPQCVSAISLNSTFIRIGIVSEVSFISPLTATLLKLSQSSKKLISSLLSSIVWWIGITRELYANYPRREVVHNLQMETGKYSFHEKV